MQHVWAGDILHCAITLIILLKHYLKVKIAVYLCIVVENYRIIVIGVNFVSLYCHQKNRSYALL